MSLQKDNQSLSQDAVPHLTAHKQLMLIQMRTHLQQTSLMPMLSSEMSFLADPQHLQALQHGFGCGTAGLSFTARHACVKEPPVQAQTGHRHRLPVLADLVRLARGEHAIQREVLVAS